MPQINCKNCLHVYTVHIELTNQCTKPQYKNTAPNDSDNLPSYNNNCTKMKLTFSIINHIIATLLYVCCTVYNLQQQINHS